MKQFCCCHCAAKHHPRSILTAIGLQNPKSTAQELLTDATCIPKDSEAIFQKMPGILSSAPPAFSMMLQLMEVFCSPKINGLKFKAKAIHCSCLKSGHKALGELLSASPRAWLTGAPVWTWGHRELFGWLWVSTSVPQRWTKRPDALPGTGDLV